MSKTDVTFQADNPKNRKLLTKREMIAQAQVEVCCCMVPEMQSKTEIDMQRRITVALAPPEHQHICRRCDVSEAPTEKKFRKCGGCIKLKIRLPAVYCSQRCAILDWNVHRKVHDAFKLSHYNY